MKELWIGMIVFLLSVAAQLYVLVLLSLPGLNLAADYPWKVLFFLQFWAVWAFIISGVLVNMPAAKLARAGM